MKVGFKNSGGMKTARSWLLVSTQDRRVTTDKQTRRLCQNGQQCWALSYGLFWQPALVRYSSIFVFIDRANKDACLLAYAYSTAERDRNMLNLTA